MKKDILFVKEFFRRLDINRISYCVLRNAEEIFRGEAHDIDMVVDFSKINLVLEKLQDCAQDLNWRLHLVAPKDNGYLLAVNLYNIDSEVPVLLHFDFFKAFSWKGYALLLYPEMLANRKMYTWMYVASPAVQSVTMLFSRFLYQNYIKDGYKDKIKYGTSRYSQEIYDLLEYFLEPWRCEFILNNILKEDWERIICEQNKIKKEIVTKLSKTQKNVNLKSKFFQLSRLKQPIGCIVEIPRQFERRTENIKMIKFILSRTFGGDYSIDVLKQTNSVREEILLKIKIYFNLCKGKLIFIDNVKGFKKYKIIVNSNKLSEEIAIDVLKKLDKNMKK